MKKTTGRGTGNNRTFVSPLEKKGAVLLEPKLHKAENRLSVRIVEIDRVLQNLNKAKS